MAISFNTTLPKGKIACAQWANVDGMEPKQAGYATFVVSIVYDTCDNLNALDFIIANPKDAVQVSINGQLLFIFDESKVVSIKKFIS